MKKAVMPVVALGIGVAIFAIRGVWRNPGQVGRTPPSAECGLPVAPPTRVPKPPEPETKPVAPGSIHLRVFEESVPVEGAQVSVLRHNSAEKKEFATLADGSRTLQGVPVGKYLVIVRHARRVPQRTTIRVEADQTTELRFDLLPGGLVHGQVTDPLGLPLPQSLVRVLDSKTQVLVHPDLQAETDAQGRYEMNGVPLQEFGLNCWHPQFKHWNRTGLLLRDASDVLELNIHMERGSQVSGRVVDEGDAPIKGASVMGLNEGTYATQCDAEGRFVLFGLGSSAVGLSVQAKGFGTVYVRGVAPETTDLTIRLPKAGQISGRIDAAPLPKVYTLLLFRYDQEIGREIRLQASTDEGPDGGFRAKDIGPGTYRLEISAPGYEALDKPYVVVLSGGTTENVTLRLKKSN
jgi:hypothetical protein